MPRAPGQPEQDPRKPAHGPDLARRIAELEVELEERRKELAAVYALSRLVAERGASLEDVLRGAVELIPASWQWPERTAARIMLGERELRDPRFREAGPVQSSPIRVDGAVAGRIEVRLTEDPPAGRPAFLAEEQVLLDAIAERLGSVAGGIEREERLRRSERRFRLAVDQFPYSFVIYDRERRIRFINARGVEVSGRTEAEILGRRDEEIQPPEVVRQLLPALERTFVTGRPQRCTIHVELETGTYDLLVSYAPVLDEEGQLLQVLGAAWDVTGLRRRLDERRATETRMQDRQKLESLGLLAGGVAHDFNNLLTIILGNAAELRARAPDPESEEDLAEIELAAQHASSLAAQMLAYAGREAIEPQPTDPSALVRDFSRLLRRAVGKTASLELDLPEGLPPVAADASRLRQVLLNLVQNAADAIGTGGGTIRIATRLEPAGADALRGFRVLGEPPADPSLVVEVTDTGCGMEAAVLERVFDPFFSTKGAGRGLGLAAVLGIVRAHGGALAAASTPGRGTTFRILLPPAAAGRERAAPAEPTAAARRRSGRILVVEDEPGVRRLARRVLEGSGYTVGTAADGPEALDRVRARPFDAIVLDVTMPGMDGVEVWRTLRRLHGSIPVLFVSGHGHQARERYPEAREAPLLPKPFRPRDLVLAVARLLEGGGGRGPSG